MRDLITEHKPSACTRDQRHLRAVEQTGRWARDAADAGDYREALSWLRVLEVVEGRLPAWLVPLRDRCLEVVPELAAA